MVVVPGLLGAVFAVDAGRTTWAQALLFLTWVTGFFAFNAASGVLRAAPPQRRRWLPAVITYTCVTAVLGLLALLVVGWELLWWVAAYLPLLGTALILAVTHRERSLLGGLVTVAAACFTLPLIALGGSSTPPEPGVGVELVTLTGLIFGYFGGSVFYVKTMIRERGRRRWLAASLIWHLAWLTIAAFWAMWPTLAWPAFFALTAGRAWLMPFVAKRRRVAPLTIGLVEIGFTLLAVAIAVTGISH